MKKTAQNLFIDALVIGSLIFAPNLFAKSDNKKLMPRFNNIYEASGVQTMADGRAVIIEDEKKRAISHVLTLASNGIVQEQPLKSDLQSNQINIKLSDMEGLAVDAEDNLFAITSFSRSKKGNLTHKREYLVRFKVEGDQVTHFGAFNKLGKFIRQKLGVNDINIEAISFNASNSKLLIGLRKPVIEGKSLIVVLENPHQVFDQYKPKLSDQVIRLDLKGGGIRALDYDKKLGGFVIVNEIKNAEGKLRSRFWFWDGNPASTPRKISVPGWENIKNVEGITSVKVNGEPLLLIVSDDGKIHKQKGSHFGVLSYEQISVE